MQTEKERFLYREKQKPTEKIPLASAFGGVISLQFHRHRLDLHRQYAYETPPSIQIYKF